MPRKKNMSLDERELTGMRSENGERANTNISYIFSKLPKGAIMKKLIAIIVIVIAALCFLSAGCSTSHTSNADSQATQMKWVGAYSGMTSNGKIPFKAVITEDHIVITWATDALDGEIYWVGTFPGTQGDRITSVGDRSVLDTGAFASQADMKQFEVKNGKLTFVAKALGQTATIFLN